MDSTRFVRKRLNVQLWVGVSVAACNQRIFGTTLAATVDPSETTLFANETAIIVAGLQSTVVGPHYLQTKGLGLCRHKSI